MGVLYLDPPIDYINSKLERVGLVDLEPYDLKPTWFNNSVGDAMVAKNIHRFLLHSQLLTDGGRVHSKINKTHLSNQFPIFFEIAEESDKLGVPFKLNLAWVLEEDFKQLILSKWFSHIIYYLLENLGFSYVSTNWIMSCVNTTQFSMMINVDAIEFFSSSRGLR